MFRHKVNPKKINTKNGEEQAAAVRRRGRPPGPTLQGQDARDRLYRTAIELIRKNGYENATMRDVAKAAGVSPGLLYRYFPSKRAVVLALYEGLSDEYAARAATMVPGKWRDRFLFALRTSLDVLGPHRGALRVLTPTLIGDDTEGVFAPAAAACRVRVQGVFHLAVAEASDAPGTQFAEPLGRILYLWHMAVILWWLLDKSREQRATVALVALIEKILPSLALALRFRSAQTLVRSFDALIREALFGEETARE